MMRRAVGIALLLASVGALAQTIYPGAGISQVNSDWSATTGLGLILNKPTLSTVASTGNFADLLAKPTTLAGHGITDGVTATALSSTLSGYVSSSALTSALSPYSLTASLSNYATTASLSSYVTSSSLTTTLGSYATTASVTSALSPYALTSSLSSYATTSALTTGLATKLTTPSGTTTQYVRGDGSLATLPVQTTFTFGQPFSRTLSVSTSYQANDPTKSAIIYPSYACTNATTVAAASGCTVQVRVSSSALTCSTGTLYYSQSLTVNLGLLITQNSTNPVPIFLPVGGYFILCPITGTFTVTTAEQTAG